jgi:hypothetical protein
MSRLRSVGRKHLDAAPFVEGEHARLRVRPLPAATFSPRHIPPSTHSPPRDSTAEGTATQGPNSGGRPSYSSPESSGGRVTVTGIGR